MYTRIKNVQLLIALMKKFEIKHLVLSPGSRNIPFVHSVEQDPYFKCYSVVDERSAAYFALGIALQVKAPVVISCTSSTATCNYLPAIAEAWHQGIPLLIITGDKDPYLLNQLEPQQIEQDGMYDRFCKKSIVVPNVNNNHDAWYCERIINEALLELTHRGCGPVHININILNHSADIGNYVDSLPEVKKITYIQLFQQNLMEKMFQEIKKYKRILIIAGQGTKKDEEYIKLVERFSEIYGCVIATEHTSNIRCKNALSVYPLVENITKSELENLMPELVITIGRNIVSYLQTKLRQYPNKFEHWEVREDGMIVDAFKNLTKVFEMPEKEFFNFFVKNADQQIKNNNYYFELWKERINRIVMPEIPFSNFYVAQILQQNIPNNSILHTGILNSTRHMMYFNIDPSIEIHSNIGTDGIDGSMSTFLGQSMATDKLCFLLLGDLSFFYDMNSLGIRDLKNNIRVLVVNNYAGSEFHLNVGLDRDKTLNLHTAASHNKSVKGWVESLGFQYLSASNKDELNEKITIFTDENINKVMVLEVFTDADFDGKVGREIFQQLRVNINTGIKDQTKQKIMKAIGQSNVERIKKVLNR